MNRQNLFSDAWDGENDEDRTRHRVFWRPDNARMGATLYELAPDAPEPAIHMHFGAEEMFFVLSGRPVLRNQHGTEELAPGDFVFCPEGRAGLHTFSNPTDEPAQILAISAGSSRTSSPTRKTDTHGWRPAIPTPSYLREAATPASSPASRSRSSSDRRLRRARRRGRASGLFALSDAERSSGVCVDSTQTGGCGRPCASGGGTRYYDGAVSAYEQELRECLAEILGEPVPPPEFEALRFYGQWLAERNLGLVPIADVGTFAWPGCWLARFAGPATTTRP